MDTETASVGLLGLGLTWFVNPVYWPALADAGVAQVVDWLGALGVVAGGSYYVGLGAAYMVAGLAGFWYAREGAPFRVLLGVALAGVAPILAGVLGTYALLYRTVGETAVVLSAGILPALLALPFGVAADPRQRRLAGWLGVALLVPYAAWVALNAGVPPRGAAAQGAYLSVGLLAVLDVGWGLPLYWLGTRLRRP